MFLHINLENLLSIAQYILIILSVNMTSKPKPFFRRESYRDGVGFRWKNEDVDMDDFLIPDDYDLQKVCHQVTYGPGWVLLKRMFNNKDVAMAKERILVSDEDVVDEFQDKDACHNNYGGLRWGLLERGKIFAKVTFFNLNFCS